MIKTKGAHTEKWKEDVSSAGTRGKYTLFQSATLWRVEIRSCCREWGRGNVQTGIFYFSVLKVNVCAGTSVPQDRNQATLYWKRILLQIAFVVCYHICFYAHAPLWSFLHPLLIICIRADSSWQALGLLQVVMRILVDLKKS